MWVKMRPDYRGGICSAVRIKSSGPALPLVIDRHPGAGMSHSPVYLKLWLKLV